MSMCVCVYVCVCMCNGPKMLRKRNGSPVGRKVDGFALMYMFNTPAAVQHPSAQRSAAFAHRLTDALARCTSIEEGKQ